MVYDELQGVNLLIRGDDLRSEFGLYQHYRRLLRLEPITHYYLPRLCTHEDGQVSKFFNARSVLDYRDDGWNKDDLIELLARSALKDPAKGWRLDNVQRYPRLAAEFDSQKRDNHSVSVSWPDTDFRVN